MQQGTARTDPEPFAECGAHGGKPRERGIEVVPPDVAAVDDTDRKHLRRGPAGGEGVDLFGCQHGVDVQAVDRQAPQQARMPFDRAEIGREQEPRGAGRQLRIGGPRGIEPGRVEVEREDGFVDLDPGRPCRMEFGEHASIGFEDTRQIDEPLGSRGVRRRLALLAEPKQGQRPDQHGLRSVPGCAGLRGFDLPPAHTRPEREIGREFWHKIVVLRIEPPRRLERGLVRVAAGHLEVRRAGQPRRVEPEAGRQGAEVRKRIEHTVVVREIPRAHEVEAGLALQRPMALAQRLSHAFERGMRGVVPRALPERLGRGQEFTLRAEARKSQYMCGGHLDGLPVSPPVSRGLHHYSNETFCRLS